MRVPLWARKSLQLTFAQFDGFGESAGWSWPAADRVTVCGAAPISAQLSPASLRLSPTKSALGRAGQERG